MPVFAATKYFLLLQTPPEVVKKKFRSWVKGALAQIPKVWSTRFLPKHFRRGSAAAYKYKPRTRPYLIRKQKVKHHQRPLVWSGSLRRMTKLPMAVRGTSKQATGKIPVPWYVNLTPKTRNAPAMHVELRSTRAIEAQVLGEFFINAILQNQQADNTVVRKVIG